MDYLKVIAKSEEELQKQIQRVKTFSDDIHMEFGLETYAKITFKKGKLTHSQNLVIDINKKKIKNKRVRTGRPPMVYPPCRCGGACEFQ